MSLSYDPDASAQANGTWDTTFLSDRDVSAQVPINFVPHPGVYVTAVCFGNGVYDDGPTENCLSNLLSSQIRRYVIDLYWDTVNRRFGLCPVEIPNVAPGATQTATSEGSVAAGTTVTPTNLDGRQVLPIFVPSSLSSVATTATSAAHGATYSMISTNGDARLLQLGPYQCSDTTTLTSLTSTFNDYLSGTSNTLQAKLHIWILNLRVAATWDQPTVVRTNLSASQLPNATEIVSAYLDNIQNVLYTPGFLLTDRENLNSSWFHRDSKDELPLTSYFATNTLPNGDLATSDGWPDENYIQVTRGKRLLVGFGHIDSALTRYNTAADGDRIFPPGYLLSNQNVSYGSNGTLNTGCFYGSTAFTVRELNNSWAVATINAIDQPDLGDAADNLTTCGISQLLNVTIAGVTANDLAEPYQDFGNNAIFSWAYGEPQNESSQGVNGNNAEFRCALMVPSDAYRGHWRVAYCNERHRVACREAQSPYLWRISGYSVPYDSGDGACTGNTTFDVPRTGLENTYLYNQVLNDAREDQSLLDGIWINFNSLNLENCWVTTGVNGTCPYLLDTSATQSRQILIPALAALIVLILTALTILVKCSANARNSRIRKRGEGGWDYEGVPS